MGYPAIDPKLFARSSAVFKKLPEMYTEMNRIQKELEELKKHLTKYTHVETTDTKRQFHTER